MKGTLEYTLTHTFKGKPLVVLRKTMDAAKLSDLLDRLSVAAELEEEGVPADELAEHDDECAMLAATFGSFGAAYAATREALAAVTAPSAARE